MVHDLHRDSTQAFSMHSRDDIGERTSKSGDQRFDKVKFPSGQQLTPHQLVDDVNAALPTTRMESSTASRSLSWRRAQRHPSRP